jgi:hypothetical protein
MSSFVPKLFSSDANEYSTAWGYFTAAMQTNDARNILEDIDEHGFRVIQDPTYQDDKNENKKRLGHVWIVAIWLGRGIDFPDPKVYKKLLEQVAESLQPSQVGFLSTVKSITKHYGHDIFNNLRDRGIFLPAAPAKNLAEKLNAILKHRNFVASIVDNNNLIGPGDSARFLDSLATELDDWLWGYLNIEDLAAYYSEKRPLTTADLDKFLKHMRQPQTASQAQVPAPTQPSASTQTAPSQL